MSSDSLYKLKRKLVSCVLTLKLENATHVPDLATKIRIAPGVAVVGQKDKVERFMDGDALLKLSIKFLPKTDEIYASLKEMADIIKKLPGVKTVSVVSFNKRNITMNGRKIIF
jgi:hypothetical protein